MLKRLLLAVFCAALFLTGTAAAAFANDEVLNRPPSSVSTDACGNPEYVSAGDPTRGDTGAGNVEEVDVTESASSMLLPVNRWGDSVSTFYSNLDEGGWFSLELRQQSREQIAGFFFSSSSTVWEGTVATSVWATAFCPIDAVGHQIDSFLGSMGDALLGAGAPLIVGLLIVLIVVAAWGSRKGTGFAMNWTSFFGKVSILTIFYFMVAGAQNSTVGADGWSPSGLSPGNIVTTTNTLISDFGGLATQGMMNVSQDGSYANLGLVEGQQNTDCRAAIGAMHGAYQQSFDGPEHQGLASQVPVAISDSWVNSVYVSYSRAQQGPYRPGDDGTGTGNSDASPHHYSTCYILDWSSPTSILGGETAGESKQAFVGRPMGGYFQQGHEMDNDGSDGLYVSTGDGEEPRWKGLIAPQTTLADVRATTNAAIAFWSVCRVADDSSVTNMSDPSHWDIAPGFGNGTWTAEGCAEWYGGDLDDEGRVEGGSLEDVGMPGFPNNAEDVLALGLPEYESQYINYVNGANPMGAIGTGFITLVASLMLFVVFGLTGLVIVVARAALLIVMIYLFVTAIIALLPGQGFQAILKAFKMLVGVVMLSAFAQVLYSLVIGLSTALNGIGSQFLGFGTVGYIGWIAITPLLALLGIHVVFKWAKLPSPFTAKGATAWGKGISTQGASAGGGAFGGSGGGAPSPRRAMSNVSKGYRDAGVSRAVNRSGSREGQMETAGREAQQGGGRIRSMMAGYGSGGVAGAVGGFAGGGRSSKAAASGAGTGAGGQQTSTGDETGKKTTVSDTSVGGGGAKGAKQRGEDAVMSDENFEGSQTEQQRVAHQVGDQAEDQYRADAAETRKARRAAARQEFKDKYLATTPEADGKRRIGVGASLSKAAGTGAEAVKARGLKDNLKTAAKIAGVGAVGASFGAVPAAAVAGAWGAKKFGGSLASKANRGLASRGLGTKGARAEFASEVDDYVRRGRKPVSGGESATRIMRGKVAAAGGAGAKWVSEANQKRAQRGEDARESIRDAEHQSKREKEIGQLTGMGISSDRAARVVDSQMAAAQRKKDVRTEAMQRARNIAALKRQDASQQAEQQRAQAQDEKLTKKAQNQLASKHGPDAASDPEKVARQKQEIVGSQQAKEAQRAARRDRKLQDKDAERARIVSKASKYVGPAASGAGAAGAGDPKKFTGEDGSPEAGGGDDGSAGEEGQGGQPVNPDPKDSGGSGGATAAPEKQGGSNDDSSPRGEGIIGSSPGGDDPNPSAASSGHSEGTSPEKDSPSDRFSDENYARTYRQAFGSKAPQDIGVGRPESPQAGQAWVQEGDSWFRAAEGGRVDRFDPEAGQWREETGADRQRHEKAQRQQPVVRKDEQCYGSRARNKNVINPERDQRGPG